MGSRCGKKRRRRGRSVHEKRRFPVCISAQPARRSNACDPCSPCCPGRDHFAHGRREPRVVRERWQPYNQDRSAAGRICVGPENDARAASGVVSPCFTPIFGESSANQCSGSFKRKNKKEMLLPKGEY